MIDGKVIETLIMSAIPGAEVSARDLTGGRDHWELQIIAPLFEGMSTLERHRKIYDVLTEPLKGPLHAVVLKTYTPTEKSKG